MPKSHGYSVYPFKKKWFMERKKLYEASKIKKKPVWIVRFLAAGAM
jgi:hypothetical protein